MNRLEAFSDGVFAIAITLLVLEIAVPRLGGGLLGAIVGEWPSYLAYLVSFATIGAVWVAHARDADVRYLTHRLTPGLAGYVAIIIVGVFQPILAVLGYLVIALFSSFRCASCAPHAGREPQRPAASTRRPDCGSRSRGPVAVLTRPG